MNRHLSMVCVGLIAGAVLLSVGCEQKLTMKRFDLVHDGESKLGVEKTLGDPKIKMTDQWTWQDSDRQIVAHVWYDAEGKVIAKQWIDPKHGAVGNPPEGAATDGGRVIKQKTQIMVVE